MQRDPDFELAARLAADTLPLGELPLSRVLLMDDSRYAWLVLVPRIAGVEELDALDRRQRVQLMDEVAVASRVLRALGEAHKINVGALGNIVRQLHVHVIARRVGDPAWPGPVWGHGTPQAYADAAQRQARVAALRGQLREMAGADFTPA